LIQANTKSTYWIYYFFSIAQAIDTVFFSFRIFDYSNHLDLYYLQSIYREKLLHLSIKVNFCKMKFLGIQFFGLIFDCVCKTARMYPKVCFNIWIQVLRELRFHMKVGFYRYLFLYSKNFILSAKLFLNFLMIIHVFFAWLKCKLFWNTCQRIIICRFS